MTPNSCYKCNQWMQAFTPHGEWVNLCTTRGVTVKIDEDHKCPLGRSLNVTNESDIPASFTEALLKLYMG